MVKNSDSVHLDNVLKDFPLYSNYYLLSLSLAFFAYVTNSFYVINYVFAAEDVQYRCATKYNCNGSFENVQEIFKNMSNDHCFQYDITSIGNDNISCTTDIGFRKIVPCKEWIYENPNSFVAEFQLACEDWKRTLVGTTHSFGYMIGLLIVGPISDRFGRKKLTIFTGVAGGIFGLLKSFSSWYWVYIVLEFLESAFGDIGSPLFILTMEIVAKEKMIIYQMITIFSFPIGCVLLALIAWYVTYWRTFLIVIYAPALLFIFYGFILDESPRWLLTKGRKEEAVKILNKINTMSNGLLSDEEVNKVECIQDEGDPTLFSLLKSTFKSKLLLKRFLVCIAWWITCTFTNYGMQINSVSLEGNKYVNFALTSLVDIPMALTGMFVLNRCNRKMPLIVSFFLGGVLCLIQPFLYEKSYLTIVFFLAGKFMASFSFNIIYIYTSELFPTYTRNSMHALCSSIGRIGSIIAPQVPLLMRYWPHLPALLFGLSSLVACLLTLLIPETADRALPNTVHEAEQVGLQLNKI